MKKIFLFNGPPGSGKDTASNLFTTIVEDVYQYKMAYPLKESSHKMLGLLGSLEDLEPIKEKALNFELLESFIQQNETLRKPLKVSDNKVDLRQFYIHLSENVMKPMFGKDIFGRLAVQYIKQSKHYNVAISDCGFEEEVMPLIEYYGKENFILVKLYREGKTFANDSRNYINIEGVKTFEINNNGTMDQLTKHIEAIIKYQDIL